MHKTLSLLVLGSVAVGAQADVAFDWVTITDPGNPGWQHPGTPRDPPIYPWETPRGSVGYEYRIGRTEITTAQWIDYINMVTVGPIIDPYHLVPRHWGAEPDPDYQGLGFRWRAISPESAQWPIAGVSWREAAKYCNWLHNGQTTDPDSLITGAYDTTTWGDDGWLFTDDHDHLPGAKYWIPSLDEWIKAVYYDPNKDGVGGWWTRPNGSDTPLVPGLPDDGETNAGLDVIDWRDLLRMPVGSYPDTQTPWGLLDASGGVSEWLETVYWPWDSRDRGFIWSEAGIAPMLAESVDQLGVFSAEWPGSRYPIMGFRLVSQVPSAASPVLFLVACPALVLGRRRTSATGSHSCSSDPFWSRSCWPGR